MAKCQETAGFLISAPCKDSSYYRCARCGKPICERHARQSATTDGKVCIACFRKDSPGLTQANDDPYLYSGTHHPEYYAYAAGAAAVGIGAAHAAHQWSGDRSAFNADDQQDWTDGEWENDYDGS